MWEGNVPPTSDTPMSHKQEVDLEQTTLYCNEKEGFKQNGEQLIWKAHVKQAT